jgi:hypothetical protein
LRIFIYKFRGIVLGAICVTLLISFANSTVSAQEAKPDFTGATSCSCYIQTKTDNLGHLNGYLVRLDIQYLENHKPRWNHPMRMYRVEDRKKAGQFCLSMYKQYFKEEQRQYEALQRQARRELTSNPIPQVAVSNSLAPKF